MRFLFFLGLRSTVGALAESVKKLKHVVILTLFSLTIFALLGVQMYMGVLTRKCVKDPDPSLNIPWEEFVSDYSNREGEFMPLRYTFY